MRIYISIPIPDIPNRVPGIFAFIYKGFLRKIIGKAHDFSRGRNWATFLLWLMISFKYLINSDIFTTFVL